MILRMPLLLYSLCFQSYLLIGKSSLRNDNIICECPIVLMEEFKEYGRNLTQKMNYKKFTVADVQATNGEE